jgi:ribosomal protein S1
MVDAKVIRLEVGKRRIALSMKQAQPDPWTEVLESYPANSLVTGRVTRLAPFGAFVELTPGVEGLIHISELSESHVRACEDVVEVGQPIETRVLGIDAEERRISLSIKAVKAPAAEAGTTNQAPAVKPVPKKRKKPLRGGLSSHYDW